MPHNRVPDPIRLDHRARHRDPNGPFEDELADLATDSGTEDITGAWSGPPDERAHPDGFTEPHQLHDEDPAGEFASNAAAGATGATPGTGESSGEPAPTAQSAAFELFESGQGMGGGPHQT